MKKQQVIETFRGKKQQILLAMQVVKQILKIDEVRTTDKNYGKHGDGTSFYWVVENSQVGTGTNISVISLENYYFLFIMV